jgi:hypothetical protein
MPSTSLPSDHYQELVDRGAKEIGSGHIQAALSILFEAKNLKPSGGDADLWLYKVYREIESKTKDKMDHDQAVLFAGNVVRLMPASDAAKEAQEYITANIRAASPTPSSPTNEQPRDSQPTGRVRKTRIALIGSHLDEYYMYFALYEKDGEKSVYLTFTDETGIDPYRVELTPEDWRQFKTFFDEAFKAAHQIRANQSEDVGSVGGIRISAYRAIGPTVQFSKGHKSLMVYQEEDPISHQPLTGDDSENVKSFERARKLVDEAFQTF